MPLLNLTLNNGEEECDMPISDTEAEFIKVGFTAGSSFTFYNDDGAWVWFNPDSFAGISINED